MQVLTVELENVKSYERANISFSQGVNAIVGHNGAGKSTILEAIGFTLFDSLDYNQTEFIRGGAKSARVRVSFVSSLDERVYDVERRIGSSSHYFVHDPQLGARLCEGKADVLRFLRQHLNVEPSADLQSIFKDAVGVPQGTLTAAFLLGSAERKRIFEALLRVEEYTRVWERLLKPLNLLKTRKGEVAEQISHLQGRLERLPVLDNEIVERKRQLTSMQEELGKAMKELDAVQATRAKLESAHNEVLKAERALSETKGKHQAVLARHQAAQKACAEAEAAHKLVTENQAGHDAYVEAQRSEEALDVRVRQRQQVETQRTAMDKRVALHEAEARARQGELDAIAEAEKTVAELHGAVIEQTRLEGVLQTALQQQARLKDAQGLVTQQQEHVDRLQNRRGELDRQLAEAQTVEARIKAATLQSEIQRKSLDEGRDMLAHLKSQADLIKEQTQQLQEVKTALCPVCEQPLSAEHREQMLVRNESRLVEMRASYREAQQQVQALEGTLQQEQDAIKKWQSELLRLPRADEATKLSEEITRASSQLKQSKGQVASLADAAQQIEETKKALEKLGDAKDRYTVASEQAKRRKTVEAQLEKAQSEVTAARKELTELQAALADFGDLDAELAAVAALVQQHRNAYHTVLGNRQQADALATRTQEVAALAKELADLTARCDELERAYAEAASHFDESAFSEAKARAERLQNDVGNLSGQMSRLKEAQEKAERELIELRSLITEKAGAETKLKRLADEEDVLETIRGKLRQAGPYISLALNRQISDGARQIFSDLMQDYSRHLTWKEDFSITLEVDGRERSFSQLSGGEQMSAALSVRLALLREMSSIDIAFFDEPTANLDEVRREQLARQILNVRGFRQLFVISHDDTFQQLTQNLIRVARVDGVSRVLVD